MAISASDIKLKLSTKSGSAGNSLTSTADASLGKYISTTEVVDNTVGNVFDAITGAENAASDVEYRCVFIHNAHATLTLYTAKVYVSAEVAGGANAAIGVDTTAASAIGSASAQALSVADEGTAPAGVSFSTPTTTGAALDLGDIPAGQCKAIWIRRTATNSAALASDGLDLTVFGDTDA
jgi:hypothetical protein